ncbi:hypothetical protein L1887_42148 [Cichorium endivia]|nr:hypothetical protein L1887_42148 [Cichorium endivia]
MFPTLTTLPFYSEILTQRRRHQAKSSPVDLQLFFFSIDQPKVSSFVSSTEELSYSSSSHPPTEEFVPLRLVFFNLSRNQTHQQQVLRSSHFIQLNFSTSIALLIDFDLFFFTIPRSDDISEGYS